MITDDVTQPPPELRAILDESARAGFTMASEPATGALLRTLAASKPGGRILELGTGTGVGTSWLLAGMDRSARLDTVESDERVHAIAREHLQKDARVTFHLADGGAFLSACTPRTFDLVYADTWPGKFTHLDEALAAVRVGGIYFIDDLLPQPNWPEDHAPKVPPLIARLDSHPDFVATRLAWSSGLMMLVRTRG